MQPSDSMAQVSHQGCTEPCKLALTPTWTLFHLPTRPILFRPNHQWLHAFSTTAFPDPLFVTFSHVTPEPLPFPFHFPISSTHSKPLFLIAFDTLAFGNSAFTLLFICSSYLSLPLNSPIVLFPYTLTFCFIMQGIWNLHFRTCICRMQLGRVACIYIETGLEYKDMGMFLT